MLHLPKAFFAFGVAECSHVNRCHVLQADTIVCDICAARRQLRQL